MGQKSQSDPQKSLVRRTVGPTLQVQHRRTTTVLSFSETIDANLSGIRLAIYRKVDEKYIISKYQNERMHALKCLY